LKRMKILMLEKNNKGKIGAPLTQWEFEQTVGKYATCAYAGEGYPDYKPNESMDEIVRRVMPNADWVIDKDDNFHAEKPEDRSYKVGVFISDLHAKHSYGLGDPVKWANLLKESNYDAYFMRYPYVYGTTHRSEIVLEALGDKAHWVPWSVNIDNFYPRDEKKYDVAFLGSTYDCYPLRKVIREGLFFAARGYKVLMRNAPPGPLSQAPYKDLRDRYVVGKDYAETLGSTRIMLFDCSYYLYAILKFFEASASGCLIMCNEPSMGKKLGFIPGETMINIDEKNWEEALQYYLKNKEEAQVIADKCMDACRAMHNHDIRAKSWILKLKELSKKND